MVKKQLLYRAAAATVLGLSLTGGVASAHTWNYGHNNNNKPSSSTKLTQTAGGVVSNDTYQYAKTGKAVVSDNHHSDGDNSAMSGAAQNKSTSGVDVTVKNTAPTPSGNQNNSKVTVDQTGGAVVNNTTAQYAESGKAVVTDNGGGSAQSGDAGNDSTSTVNVTIGNN